MLTVALTGGIGSGKSLAGEYFALIGATVVDSDQLARDVIERGSPGFDQVVSVFGDSILKNGIIERHKLAELIFGSEKMKADLESIIHPLVRSAFEAVVAAAPAHAVVVNLIPLLFETSGADRFDYVIAIEAPIASRRERLLKRGLSANEIERRLSAQATDEDRRGIADHIFINDGDEDKLLRQVENIYEDVLLPRALEKGR